jgi:hypothetical protein
MPSGDVITLLVDDVAATATYRPLPYATELQELFAADEVAQVAPSFFPPALRLIRALVTVEVVVDVRSVKESELVADAPGPILVEAASVPSPIVTIGVVEETA